MKKKRLNEILKISCEDGIKYEDIDSIMKKIEREIIQGTRTLARVPFNSANGAKVWREHLKPALEVYDYIFSVMESREQEVRAMMLRETRKENMENNVDSNESRPEDNKA